MTATQKQAQQQALNNAVTGQSMMNYQAIIAGFMEKGIAPEAIEPRSNVFTFAAWKALGRSVKKGEHGVKVVTFVPMNRTDKDSGEVISFKAPRTTTVFHVSQTKEIE